MCACEVLSVLTSQLGGGGGGGTSLCGVQLHEELMITGCPAASLSVCIC